MAALAVVDGGAAPLVDDATAVAVDAAALVVVPAAEESVGCVITGCSVAVVVAVDVVVVVEEASMAVADPLPAIVVVDGSVTNVAVGGTGDEVALPDERGGGVKEVAVVAVVVDDVVEVLVIVDDVVVVVDVGGTHSTKGTSARQRAQESWCRQENGCESGQKRSHTDTFVLGGCSRYSTLRTPGKPSCAHNMTKMGVLAGLEGDIGARFATPNAAFTPGGRTST